MWSVVTAWQLGASVFFVFFFSKISILSVVLFPVFYSRGIRFLVEVAAEMCLTEFGVRHADVLLILPVQRGKQQTKSCKH